MPSFYIYYKITQDDKIAHFPDLLPYKATNSSQLTRSVNLISTCVTGR